MLSNKLTFFLSIFVVLLIMGFCLSVSAQIAQEVNLWQSTSVSNIVIPANGFIVFGKEEDDADYNGGITHPGREVTYGSIPDLQDLEKFFMAGGTVQIAMGVAEDAVIDGFRVSIETPVIDGSTVIFSNFDFQPFVISEIMWGRDESNTTSPNTPQDKQWIEIYNTTDLDIPIAREPTTTAVSLSLVFTPFTPVGSATDSANRFIVDGVSNVGTGGKWNMPGSSGVAMFDANNVNAPAQSNLVSAYRNIDYAKVTGIHKLGADNRPITGLEPGTNRFEQLKGIPDGWLSESWKATPVAGSRNMARWHIGSPGMGHIMDTAFTFDVPVTSIPSDGVVINEVHNNPKDDLDWVELYNAGTEAVGLHGYELTYIHGSDPMKTDIKLVGKDKGDDDSKRFPKNEDFKLKAGEYLLIVNRHPSETNLANGLNIDEVIAGTEVKAGASHQYIVRDTLKLPNENLTLILRKHLEKNSRQDGDNTGRNYKTSKAPSEEIVDFAGNHGIAVDSSLYNTKFWPFRGWDRQAATTGKDGKNNRFPNGESKSWARKRYQANDGHHKDAWEENGVGAKGGIGYDPGVDLRLAPGTPGYANGALMDKTVDDKGASTVMGEISISEIMVDAGPRWNLIQWIELYNSSMTEGVNLKGWELEIRNATDDVESYVDSSFEFNDAYILPNQTLLLISGTGTNDVADNREYNLYQHHRRALGLTNRRSVLLSPEGFYLKLSHADPADPNNRRARITVDEAGNVMIDGAARNVMWELPASNADMRQSLVRQYGGKYFTTADSGSPEMPNPGTEAASWEQSDLLGAGISFYGHRDDVSTPGYRLGGPLPVSLSKFRPVRNQTTGHVDITWITESELNNAGFNILRSEAKTGEFKVINVKGIVAGNGTTSEKHVYTFTDTTAKPNVVYYYRIEDVSINGQRTTLTTTHLRGHVGAAGKLTTRWGELKSSGK